MRTFVKKPAMNTYWAVAILFTVTKLVVHLLTNTKYELLRDEMLYFNMGDHLSSGYLTVPPMTGLLAFLVHRLFGFSVFGIRLFPAIEGAASVIFIALIIRELRGGTRALIIAATTYILTTGLLLSDTLFTPNSFDEMIWVIATWLIIRLVKTGDPVRWIPVAIVLAIGFLNKYSVLFFTAGFVIALIAEGRWYLFRSRYFIIAVATAILIITPNILWQYNHQWPVISHMSELKTSQLDILGYSGFFSYLFSFSQGSILIWITGLVSLLFLKGEREYRYLGTATLIIMVMFIILKGKGYYVLGLLPFLFAFGGYVLEKYLTGRRAYISHLIFACSAMLSMAALPSGLPVMSLEKYGRYLMATSHYILHPMMKWDNGEKHGFPQAYADMTGWRELAGLVAQAYNSLNESEKKSCTIYCERSYGYAGAIYYYGREFNLPQPVTFHDNYILWAPDTIPQGPVIYIYRNANPLKELFSDISETGSVKDRYFRETGLKVFLCKSPLKDIQAIYASMAKEEKSRY